MDLWELNSTLEPVRQVGTQAPPGGKLGMLALLLPVLCPTSFLLMLCPLYNKDSKTLVLVVVIGGLIYS